MKESIPEKENNMRKMSDAGKANTKTDIEMAEDEGENKLDELLNLEVETSHKELKKIERGISKRIYRKTGGFVLVIAALLVLLVFLVSQLTYLSQFNPKTSVNFTLDNRKNDMDEFGLLMQTFVGMFMPDNYMYVDGGVKKTGFGNYEISAAFGSREDGYRGKNNGNIVIKWEKMYMESAGESPFMIFSYPAPFTSGEKPGELLAEVEELPDSSYLTVSLMFKEEKNIEQMYDFMKNYGGSYRYTYLTTYSAEGAIPIGLDMERVSGYDVDGEFSEKYPDFYSEPRTDQPLDKEAVANCYHSRIRLLMDNPEFFRLACTVYEDLGTWMKETLDRCMQQELAKGTDEITFIACRGRIKKKDLLRLIESDEVSLIKVHKVSLSDFPE